MTKALYMDVVLLLRVAIPGYALPWLDARGVRTLWSLPGLGHPDRETTCCLIVTSHAINAPATGEESGWGRTKNMN